MDFGAIVLAGGRATRLGGADKASLEVDGVPLLERTLAALSGASSVVVVGDERPTSRRVTWVREHPAYGGPVAATYAGLDALTRDSPGRLCDSGAPEPAELDWTIPILVLAVDMPEVTSGTVARLLAGIGEREGAVLTDGGRRHLAFVATAAALERVRPAEVSGGAMRDLWSALDLADVPALADEAHDLDHPDDLPPGG